MAMSLPTGQNYNNLSSWREARYQAYVQTWEARLTAVQAQITQLLENPVESYNFSAGEGSQQATRRKLQALQEQESWLIGRINKFQALLYGGGVVTVALRRK